MNYPKNKMNLCIQTEPLTVGADTLEQILFLDHSIYRLLYHVYENNNSTYTVPLHMHFNAEIQILFQTVYDTLWLG